MITEEEWCSFKRELCVSDMHFEDKSLHNNARVARGQDGVEVKIMVDLVLMEKDMLRYVQDVRSVREIGRGLSDHYVTMRKVGVMD